MSIEYTAPPQSRNEAILADTINDVEYTDPPQSRIEDLLIDLNGKVIGKQDALTEEQLAAVNSGIDEEKVAQYDDIYAVMNYNALNHNGIYRGKDLTNIYTVDEIYERVHNGTFEDLYLGDYFTKTITTDLYSTFTGSAFVEGTTYYERSGADLNHWVYEETADATYDSNKTYYTMQIVTEDVKIVFAGFNYYFNTSRAANIPSEWHMLTPHIAVILMSPFETLSRFNTTDTTVGGYYNSELHQTTLPCYAKALKQSLNNHVIRYLSYLTSTVDATKPNMANFLGIASAQGRYETELTLLSEYLITGHGVWSSSPYEVGYNQRILPLFNFKSYIDLCATDVVGSNMPNQWLSTVVSTENFGLVSVSGVLGYAKASTSRYFNTLFLFG